MAAALGASWPEYATPEDVWNELADLCPNWYGIRYPRLEENGIQWPCTDLDDPGTPYLHSPAPALGKGRFFPVEYQPPIEQTDSEFPFVLSTGRTLYHYNSATMTMREAGVVEKQERPFFEIHPDDATALGIAGRGGGAACLAPRRADRRRDVLDARLPGPRLDGAPLRGGEGELAPPRRRRPADRHAGVQGVGVAGRGAVSLCARPVEARFEPPHPRRVVRVDAGAGRPRRGRGARTRVADFQTAGRGGSVGRGRRRPGPRSCSRCC